jgi:hypothetical protein
MPPAPLKKHIPLPKLHKKLWDLISPLIRQKDVNDEGFGACITCDRLIHWKKGDAGHFLPGRHSATKFDPMGIYLQCKPCNGTFMNSAPPDIKERYEKAMIERLGNDFVEEFKKLDRQHKSWERKHLEFLIEAAKTGLPTYEKVYNQLRPR